MTCVAGLRQILLCHQYLSHKQISHSVHVRVTSLAQLFLPPSQLVCQLGILSVPSYSSGPHHYRLHLLLLLGVVVASLGVARVPRIVLALLSGPLPPARISLPANLQCDPSVATTSCLLTYSSFE